MPRKKVAKNAVRKKKPVKQVAKTTINTLSKLETEFTQTPVKLAELHAKEVSALKQKESKLQTTVKKIQVQISKLEKSISAAKNVKTAAGKKQLAAAKKVLNDTKKDFAFTNTALKQTAQAISDAELQAARLTALAKYLKNFDKEWANEIKRLKEKAKAEAAAKAKAKAEATAKAKAKAEAAAKAKAAKAEAAAKAKAAKAKAKASKAAAKDIHQPALTIVEQTETFDNIDENAEFDDVKQAIS